MKTKSPTQGMRPTGASCAFRAGVMRDQGFTLVELVVVLVLITALGAVTATRWTARDATAGYQAERLARDLRHAQMLATTWNARLRVNAAANRYWVSCAVAGPAPCNVNPVIDPATGGPFDVTLENGVTLAVVGGGVPDFDRLGRPTDAVGTLLNAARTYRLNAGAQTWSARIEPVTGFVVVTTP